MLDSPRLTLTRPEKRNIAGMGVFILLLHVLGWGALIFLIAPAQYSLGSQGILGIGLGVTVYVLGLRHAFDADHIAAIDNTTRKLMADGQKPLSVGFWFSLGHSSIVFGMCLLLSIGVRSLVGQVKDDTSTLHDVASLIGTLVSGSFLMVLGLINLVVLVGIVKVFRKMRRGSYSEESLEEQLNKRGFMNRILGRFTRTVTKPWHMFPIGLLFGLGFDTATEVTLLVIAGGAALFQLPWYVILVLPILFAAGMTLLDTIDGILMNYAYGWAFSKPVRKVYYNMTITGLSVVIALIVGTIELGGLLAEKLGVTSGPLALAREVPLDHVGYAIVILFAVTWIVALLVWRFGRIEQKWSTPLATATPVIPLQVSGSVVEGSCDATREESSTALR